MSLPQFSRVIEIDTTDTGHRFGFEDALNGNDQRGSMYFSINSGSWTAYNEGFADGCYVLFLLTGKQRHVWLP